MTIMRSTLSNTNRTAQTSMSRASVRDFNDNNLMQEITKADVMHSETPSDFERWQMVGMTSVPLKQDEDEQQQQQGQQGQQGGGGSEGSDNYNHNQPKGKSAEAVMLYLNGSRSHPVAIVDDRRVRPYDMKNGEGAHYAPNGSEQMAYHKVADDQGKGEGYYLVTRDGKAYGKNSKEVERMVSMRHVEKQLQSREIQDQQQQGGGGGGGSGASVQARAGETSGGSTGGGQQQQQRKRHKHEGDSVNTEVRVTKKYIEMFTGEKRVARYDKDANVWEINESGGVFKVIIDNGKIVCQHQSIAHSMKVDANHVHIKYGDNAIFVDSGGCWSSKPIQQKSDPD